MTRLWIFLTVIFGSFFSGVSLGQLPPMQLAKVYAEQKPVNQYLVSEKFDGVRAFWDGKTLTTRGGHPIFAPDWFLAQLPNVQLDGELWLGYQQFEAISSIARTVQPSDKLWQNVRYLVFDAPRFEGAFLERYQTLQTIFSSLESNAVQLIPQYQFEQKSELEQFFQAVLARGGEGVMLHEKSAPHQVGRSDAILKYKPFEDAEAKVIAYQSGKGKYSGMLGALWVEDELGRQFKLGSGFSDELRRNPPAIGTLVTYRFQGLTKNGLPKFARFLRVRDEL